MERSGAADIRLFILIACARVFSVLSVIPAFVVLRVKSSLVQKVDPLASSLLIDHPCFHKGYTSDQFTSSSGRVIRFAGTSDFTACTNIQRPLLQYVFASSRNRTDTLHRPCADFSQSYCRASLHPDAFFLPDFFAPCFWAEWTIP
jgi:hypothetical protein